MPRATPEHRLQHDPPVVVGVDHLVAGREGEAHDRFEVPAGRAVDGGEVAPADAGQPWPKSYPLPVRAGPVGRRRRGRAARRWHPPPAPASRRPAPRQAPGCARSAAPSSSRSRAGPSLPGRQQGTDGQQRAVRPAPSTTARPATPACGRSRRGGSRGSRPPGSRRPPASAGPTWSRHRPRSPRGDPRPPRSSRP